ncbi:crossover junction endodeoxyribonuclease RuvC [Candidatus Microgenomates bacterium]|nr:crossover junction endodeoxyribonuclease RuvC [Candidatus Microgenomates bacterium]
MRVLGIDPGTAITGYGLVDSSKGGIQFVAGGVIRTAGKQLLAPRLLEIFNGTTQLIAEYQPDQMAIEILYFAKNVTTGMAVSHARGVVLLAAAQAGLPVAEYTPSQVKQALTGYGKADKKQMQAMAQRLLKLSDLPKPDDAADALAVAICHTAVS